jgi:hypothetical protein
MTKLQWKIYTLIVGFGQFTTIHYDMSVNNTKKLFKGLTELDQKKFMFDADQVRLKK